MLVRVGALVSVFLLVAHGWAAEDAKKPAELRRDSRLKAIVELDTRALTLRDVFARVRARTHVDLLAQSDVLSRPVAVAIDGKSAAEVMELIARLFGGQWFKESEAYVLVSHDVLYLSTSSALRSGSTNTEERRLAQSLDAIQTRILAVRSTIPFQQLRPDQQQLVKSILVNRYFKQPGQFPSDALVGWGVSVGLMRERPYDRGGATGPESVRLILKAPTVQPDGKVVIMPVIDLPELPSGPSQR